MIGIRDPRTGFASLSSSSVSTATSLGDPASARLERATRWVPWGVAVLALWHLVVVAGVMALRVGYPFELEWMEGGVLDHVLRLKLGRPIYGPPGLDFIPYVYPPLYYYVVLVVGWVVGHGFLAGRLVSVLSTVVAALLVARLAARSSGARVQGLLAAGCLAAAYPVTGFWFDLVRVDAFLLALLLGACAALRSRRAWGAVAAALLLVAACLAKQNALAFLGAAAVITSWRSWRQGAVLLAAALPLLAAGAAWLWFGSDGWIGYYLLEVPRSHGIHWYALGTLRDDLLRFLPALLLVLPSVWLYTRAHGSFLASLRQDPLPWFVAAATAFSVSSRLHFGGAENVLIPLYAFVGVYVVGAPWRLAGSAARIVLPCVLAVQLGMWAWNPARAVPTAEHRAAGEHFLELLDELPPRVLLPFHGHYLWQLGREPCFHYQGLLDLTMPTKAYSARPELEAALLEEVDQSFRRGDWDAVILDSTDKGAVESTTMVYCDYEGPIFDQPGAFLQPSGMLSHPDAIWLPKPR